MAIKSFKCLDTQKLFDGKRVARWVNIERPALRKSATNGESVLSGALKAHLMWKSWTTTEVK